MAMTLNSEEQNRVNNVYNEREKALAENNSLYEGLINNASEVRDAQNRYLAQQEAYQNQQADVNLERTKQQIDKQKEEAQKAKDVEGRKALNTYMAYTNPYSSTATDNLNRGLANSGVSATEKLGALTSLNDRMARANTALNDAITNYNLQFDQAKQDRDLQQGQNALNKLALELQNAQDYYNNVSSLKQQQLSNSQNIKNAYMDQYNTVYSQILKEQQQAEAARQWQAEYNLSKQKFNYEKQYNNYNLYGDGSGLNSEDYDTTEYYQAYSPVSVESYGNGKGLSSSGMLWYLNNFNKHSYQKKDLDNVLGNAVKEKKLSAEDAEKIYNSYGIYA